MYNYYIVYIYFSSFFFFLKLIVAALPQDLGLVPSIQMLAHNCISSPGDLEPSSGPFGSCMHIVRNLIQTIHPPRHKN